MAKQTQTQTTKGATKGAQASQPAAPKAEARYCMLQGFRPGAGKALFAHTAAFMELSGMNQGKRIPRSMVLQFLGAAATKHHLNSTGFFAQYADGVEVSPMGKEGFALRAIDPELFAGFVDILSTGKTSRSMPASFTNEKGIKAV
jgi:hypothetical protein